MEFCILGEHYPHMCLIIQKVSALDLAVYTLFFMNKYGTRYQQFEMALT